MVAPALPLWPVLFFVYGENAIMVHGETQVKEKVNLYAVFRGLLERLAEMRLTQTKTKNGK